MILVSVDCGLRACGVAVWNAGARELERAALVVNQDKTGRGPLVWRHMALAVEEWIGFGLVGALLAIETQQRRPWDTPAKTAALFEIQGVAGAIAALDPFFSDIRGYLPSAWKGTIKKAAMIERIKRRVSTLENSRVALPSAAKAQTDVWDAVGIGLHYFGRLEKVRVVAR